MLFGPPGDATWLVTQGLDPHGFSPGGAVPDAADAVPDTPRGGAGRGRRAAERGKNPSTSKGFLEKGQRG
jgi:hypothetical protein